MIRHGDEHYRSVLDLVLLALLLSCGLRPAQGAVVGEVHSGTPCSAQTSSNGSCSSSALYKCAVACHANETCRAFVWEAETGHCYAHDHQKASGDNRFGPHNTLGDTVANINISSYDQSVRFGLQQCTDFCAMHDNCRSFMWDLRFGHCSLYLAGPDGDRQVEISRDFQLRVNQVSIVLQTVFLNTSKEACFKMCSSDLSCAAFGWQAAAAKCTTYILQEGATSEDLFMSQAIGHTSGVFSAYFIHQHFIHVQSSPLQTSRHLLQPAFTAGCISTPYTLYHFPDNSFLDIFDARDVRHCCDLCLVHHSNDCASYQYSTTDNSCLLYSNAPNHAITGVQDACGGRAFCPSLGKLVGYLPNKPFLAGVV